MLTRLRNRVAQRRSDPGLTLIELLVSMMIFSIIMGIITAGIVSMLQTSNRAGGQVSNLETGYRVISKMDDEARYANVMTAPGTGTDGSLYVEYSIGNFGQQQTCTQWRYVPSPGKLQWRTWQPPLSGTGSVTATSWATAAINISQIGSNPVFSISPSNSANDKEELAVMFQETNGTPTQTTQFQTTLTAINSTSATAPTSACAQVGRP